MNRLINFVLLVSIVMLLAALGELLDHSSDMERSARADREIPSCHRESA